MYLEQPLDDMAHAIEVGRRRLAGVDLGSIAESAVAGARAAAPDRFSRKKRSSRWPFVAAVLILGSVVVAVLYLVPLGRRTSGAADSDGEDLPPTRSDQETDESDLETSGDERPDGSTAAQGKRETDGH